MDDVMMFVDEKVRMFVEDVSVRAASSCSMTLSLSAHKHQPLDSQLHLLKHSSRTQSACERARLLLLHAL